MDTSLVAEWSLCMLAVGGGWWWACLPHAVVAVHVYAAEIQSQCEQPPGLRLAPHATPLRMSSERSPTSTRRYASATRALVRGDMD